MKFCNIARLSSSRRTCNDYNWVIVVFLLINIFLLDICSSSSSSSSSSISDSSSSSSSTVHVIVLPLKKYCHNNNDDSSSHNNVKRIPNKPVEKDINSVDGEDGRRLVIRMGIHDNRRDIHSNDSDSITSSSSGSIGYNKEGRQDRLRRASGDDNDNGDNAGNKPLDLNMMVNNLKGESAEGYYVNINIGTPPQQLQVLIDTGSSNFAIACENSNNMTSYFQRNKSSSYEEEGSPIYVPYTEGWWNGILGTDDVSLTSASSLTSRVNIACITESADFYPADSMWQGILGLGYSKLARPDPSVSPFWDSVLASHSNLSDVFSVQLCGSSFVHSHETPLKQGSLVLGGVLPQLAASPFFYAPIYKEWYYEVVITDIELRKTSLGLDCKEYNLDKTIVDTGTTSIRLPHTVFKALQEQIVHELQFYEDVVTPHQGFFDGEDLMCYFDMAKPFAAFPVISFYLMSSENTAFRLDLTPQHYLRPVSDFSDQSINHTCVKYGFLPSDSGTVLGAVFMEAFYVVFDRAKKRIGFAQTSCPLPDPAHKIIDVSVDGPFSFTHNLRQCAFKKPEANSHAYVTVTYVLLAFSLVIFIPFLLFLAIRMRDRICRYRRAGCEGGWQRQEDDTEKQNVLPLSSSNGGGAIQ